MGDKPMNRAFWYVISVLPPLLLFLLYVFGRGIENTFKTEINPTIINGVLTVSAIIFGFATFPMKEHRFEKIEVLFIPPLLSFFTVAYAYFLESFFLGHLSPLTLTLCMVNCLISFMSLAFITELSYNTEEKKEQP